MKSLYFLFFILLSCLGSKKTNMENSKNAKLHFLPVTLSYTGIALDDSIKYFISQYLSSKNIEIINKDYARQLMENEIHRAGNSITAHEPEERWKQLDQNQRYVFNSLELSFKLDADGQQIDMGWKVSPFPPKFSRIIKGNWRYLKNHKISDLAPQDELKILRDSIIYSKTLY